jgi:cytoskeletal protein CcmA (bactofilin family)
MDGDSFVTVNGVTIPGRTISMTNGVLFVDGKRYEEKEGEAGAVVGCRELTIVINGNVRGSVSTSSGNVRVTGNCETAKSASGNVEIEGDVSGSVSSMSGDVRVEGKVSGSASSMSGRVTTINKLSRVR